MVDVDTHDDTTPPCAKPSATAINRPPLTLNTRHDGKILHEALPGVHGITWHGCEGDFSDAVSKIMPALMAVDSRCSYCTRYVL